MLLKVALTALVGALSINALTVPVARSPAPEPESLSLLGRGLGYSTPGSAPGRSLFKREPSFELEIRAPDDTDLHDPEPEHKSFGGWLKSLKENVKKKKGEALTKLKEKLGIGKRETEPEPKSMTKPEKERYKRKKKKVAKKMQKKKGSNRMKDEVAVTPREPEPEPKTFKEWFKSVGDTFNKLGQKIANKFKKKKT